MNRVAIEADLRAWLDELAAHHIDFEWLREVGLSTHPAFLVDSTTPDGDDYKAGAVSISVTSAHDPSPQAIDQLHNAVVSDRTLGRRVKRATFERGTSVAEATIVIVPL
jgi:hypothetical protein